jgi:hypothetical protein
MKTFALIAVVAASQIGTSAGAQDIPTALDVTAVGRTMVLTGQNQGYIDRARGKSTSGSEEVISPRARAYCEDYPNVRNRLGAKDPRVLRLRNACRQAGYRY